MTRNIKSIVALDLETTGLPIYDGFTTKITEISFVACSVEHLKSSETIPRVVHKLNLCFNPRKLVDEVARKTTGLDNYLLEYEKSFTENSGKLIKSYLEHLQQPVCLIAHNGDSFDFPILAKEFKRINMALQENVFCMDSLHAFREIDTINENKIMNDIIKDKQEIIELQELQDDFIDNAQHLTRIEKDSDNEDENTNFQQLNETTPHRLTDNSTIKRKSNTSAEGTSAKTLCHTRRSSNTPRRQLFSDSIVSPSTKSPKNPNKYKTGYKLAELYKRFYKKEPLVTHNAEADVLLLLHCIVATKKDFIPFMNEDAVLYSEIKPLGTIINH